MELLHAGRAAPDRHLRRHEVAGALVPHRRRAHAEARRAADHDDLAGTTRRHPRRAGSQAGHRAAGAPRRSGQGEAARRSGARLRAQGRPARGRRRRCIRQGGRRDGATGVRAGAGVPPHRGAGTGARGALGHPGGARDLRQAAAGAQQGLRLGRPRDGRSRHGRDRQGGQGAGARRGRRGALRPPGAVRRAAERDPRRGGGGHRCAGRCPPRPVHRRTGGRQATEHDHRPGPADAGPEGARRRRPGQCAGGPQALDR